MASTPQPALPGSQSPELEYPGPSHGDVPLPCPAQLVPEESLGSSVLWVWGMKLLQPGDT